jgi:hypothetical protein
MTAKVVQIVRVVPPDPLAVARDRAVDDIERELGRLDLGRASRSPTRSIASPARHNCAAGAGNARGESPRRTFANAPL